MDESFNPTLADVLAGVAARHALDVRHKFVFEFGLLRYRHDLLDRKARVLHDKLPPFEGSSLPKTSPQNGPPFA